MPMDLTKKCPYCSVTLDMKAVKCFSCNQKVGKPNKYGIAEKPFDWFGYARMIISIAALIIFIWWGFFRDK